MTAKTILLLGATGTIGEATYHQLLRQGFHPVAAVRSGSNMSTLDPLHVTNAAAADILAEGKFDGVVSCVASRTGLDAWEVDYGLNSQALAAAVRAGVRQYVLLSAICVQKPRLEFQHAKLAFEKELKDAPISWSIVRATAYFKSLSGQLERVRNGKPFLVFGDGELTSCKPISDRDTARFLVSCLTDPSRQNRVLPIGGPGPAMTSLEQGELLFEALGRKPRFSHIPAGLLSAVGSSLRPLGFVSRACREKAELARIGYHYATESMLVWDETNGRYSPEQTPEFGSDRLYDHYAALAKGLARNDLGKHAVF